MGDRVEACPRFFVGEDDGSQRWSVEGPVVGQYSGSERSFDFPQAVAAGRHHLACQRVGVDLGFRTAGEARAERDRLGPWGGARSSAPKTDPASAPVLDNHEAVLAGWRLLLDAGRLQDGEPHLAGTARPPVARMSAATAAGIGATEGATVTVSTGRGSISLPLAITDMPDRVVWLPLNSPGSAVHRQLGVGTGAVVQIKAGGAQ